MKIKRLLVEDFGKFHQAEFVLGDRLNVMTGMNESGKTTLRHFICAMWYGLERERGLRARKDEYTRYKPWYSGRFQGSMEFEAEGVSYRLSRNFLTKEVVLLNLNNGYQVEDADEFLRENGLPSEEVYRNTYWVGNACRTEAVLAENYRNHMANYACTGGMNLNLAVAKERLKRQKREIERQLPEKELLRCMEQMSAQKELEEQLGQEERRLEELRREASVAEKRVAAAQEALEKTYLQRKEEDEKQKRKQKGQWILGLFSVVGVLLCMISGRWQGEFAVEMETGMRLLGGGLLCVGVLLGGALVVMNRKSGRKEIEEQAERLQLEIREGFEQVKAMFPLMEKERFWMEQTEERLQACAAIRKHYEELLKQKETLDRECAAIALAIQALEETSAGQYRDYGDVFYKKMSEYAQDFTDHAYDRLVADEELNVCAITSDKKLEVADVSHGTGEQFYLALRFAAADVFDPEKKNPVILDDSFAAFDELRLESALLSLIRSGRQTLLFSCTGREEQMLRRMGVSYEKVFEKTKEDGVGRN